MQIMFEADYYTVIKSEIETSTSFNTTLINDPAYIDDFSSAPTTLDVANICRICLAKTDIFIPVEEKVQVMWNFCFDIQINRDDGLPQQICPNCKEAVEQYCSFKAQYLQNELFLKNLLSKEPIQDVSTTPNSLQDHDYTPLTQDDKPVSIINDNVQFDMVTEEVEKNEPVVLNRKVSPSKTRKTCRKKMVTCKWCGQSFSRSQSFCKHVFKHLNKNQVQHNKTNNFECNICYKQFTSRARFLKHQKILHTRMKEKQTDFSCNICGQTYTTKFYLKYHILKHQGAKNFTCSFCGMSFLLKQYLKEHLEIHEPGQYSCEKCGKLFSRRVTLKRHRARHAAIRKHVCEICSKSFLEKEHLKNHLVVHTKERRFACQICDKRYGLKGTLTKHMLTHKEMK